MSVPQTAPVEEPPYVVALFKDGYWVEQFFDTPEAAGAAWKQIPVGVFARYFVEGTLVRQGSGPR